LLSAGDGRGCAYRPPHRPRDAYPRFKNRGHGPIPQIVMNHTRTLLRDEDGATAVEYGLIVAAIAGMIIAIVALLGKKLVNSFNNVQSRL
jgi:pilus assembly protein Flp/PilA